jgi:hypothetical protein
MLYTTLRLPAFVADRSSKKIRLGIPISPHGAVPVLGLLAPVYKAIPHPIK